MKLKILRGTTSKLIRVFISDSSKADGSGLTGLVYNSGSLTAYYIREGDSSATSIALATMTLGTWATGGFVAVDGTNMPGLYEVGLPNAAISTGNSVVIMFKGATNMVPVLCEIELDAVNYQSANDFITGINSLAPPTNWNSMVINGSGRIDVGTWLGTAVTAATAGIPDVNTKNYNNVAAATDANNLPKVDVEDWKAGVVPAVNVTGVPKIDVADWNGTAPNNLISGRVDSNAGVVGDKTGYALTSSEHTLISGTDVPAALTAQGYTTTRAGYLDTLNGLVATIWNTLTSTLTTAGSIGKLLSTFLFDGGGNVHSTPQTGVTVTTNNDKTGYALTSGEHTAIAGDVLNATASSYDTALTIGAQINAAGSVGDPWSTSLPGSYISGQAGYIVGTDVPAIKTQTDKLTFDGSDNILSTPQTGVTVTTNSDKTGYALTSGEHTAISGTDVPAGLTTQGYTSARSGYMDVLNGLVASIWATLTSGLTTAGSIGKLLSTFTFTGSNVNADSTFSGSVTVGGYDSGQDPATLVLDVAASGHNIPNTIGAKITSAGSAGDPWSTLIPGSYGPGSAGSILGNSTTNIVTAIMSYVIDGTLDFQDSVAIMDSVVAGKFTVSFNQTTLTQTTTYYRQDGTTILAVMTTVYDSTGRATSRMSVLSNLP